MANETIEVLRIPGTLFPRGPYDENAAYKFLNFVESGGNGYVCLRPCTGIPVTNTAYWFKFVFKGEKGDAFTYADLTAEQKAELVRDATAAAQTAVTSAQSAADDAAAVLQKFNTIKAAIDAIDPTSTEGSIQALAAKQGLLESDLDALGPKINKVSTDLTGEEAIDLSSLEIIGGHLISNSGIWNGAAASYGFSFIPIPNDANRLRVTNRHSSQTLFMAILTSSNVPSGQVRADFATGESNPRKIAVNTTQSISISSDAKYVYVRMKNSSDSELYNSYDIVFEFDGSFSERLLTAETGIDSLKSKVGVESDISSLFVLSENKYIKSTDGTSQGVSDGTWSYTNEFVPIERYSYLRITMPLLTASSNAGIAFYSEQNESSFISGFACNYDSSLSDRTYQERTIIVPSGAKYVRTSWLSSVHASYSVFKCYGKIEGELDEVKEAVSPLIENPIYVKYDNIGFTRDKVVSTASATFGQLVSSNLSASDKIPINEGNVVELTVITRATSSTSGIVFYGQNDTPLVGISRPNTGADGIMLAQYTAPVGATYFRTTFWKDNTYGAFSCKVFSIINSPYTGGSLKYASAESVKILSNAVKTHLRILVYGNSYSCDSWSYVPFILKNYGYTCEIYHYHRGAMSLWDLYEEWNDPSTTGSQRETGGTGLAKAVHYINTKYSSSWSLITFMTPKECLELGGWDMISLQQMSISTTNYSTFEPYLTNILTYIRQSFQNHYVLGWSGMYTRKSNDNPSGNLVALETCIKSHPFTLLMPIGTAVFNARTNDVLKATSDTNDMWADDNVHLQEGIPCYMASLTIVQALLNHFFNRESVLGDTLVPDAITIATFNHPEKHGIPLNVNDETRFLAQKAAIQAVKYPYEITTI